MTKRKLATPEEIESFQQQAAKAVEDMGHLFSSCKSTARDAITEYLAYTQGKTCSDSLVLTNAEKILEIPAKVLELPTFDNCYRFLVEADNGNKYRLDGLEVSGTPGIGDSGTLKYESSSARGWWTFRCD